MISDWPILRWPRRPGLLPSFLSLGVAGYLLVVVMGFAVLLAYTAGYTTGTRNAYATGLSNGQVAACEALANQARWAVNVENDLVASKQDSTTTAAKIKAVSAAALHYACTHTAKAAPNAYEPPVAP